jgi:hypothetical protein
MLHVPVHYLNLSPKWRARWFLCAVRGQASGPVGARKCLAICTHSLFFQSFHFCWQGAEATMNEPSVSLSRLCHPSKWYVVRDDGSVCEHV